MKNELTDFHRDALSESVNIGIGKAAAVLASLVDHPIEFSIPKVTFVHLDTIREFLNEHYENWSNCVLLKFDGGFSGDAMLIYTTGSTKRWVQIIGGAQFGDVDEILSAMESDLLLEVANIIINGCIGCIANLLEVENNYHLPILVSRAGSEIVDGLLEEDKSQNFGFIINTKFSIEGEEVNTELFITLQESSVPIIIERLMSLV